MLFYFMPLKIVLSLKNRHFTGRAAGLAPWTDFREHTVSGRSLRTPRTVANADVQGLNFTANQRKERSFVRYVNLFGAVYENGVMAVSTVVVFSFSNILLKLVVWEKSSPTGLFCILLSTRACITLVVL